MQSGPRADRAAPGPRRLRALLQLVVAGGCWGLAAIIAKTAFDRGVAPVRMAEARSVVALCILAIALAWRRRDLLRPPRGSFPVLAAFGLTLSLVTASYYLAIDRLAVGVAISIQYTAPVILLVAGGLTGLGRPTRLAWVAAGVTLLGAVLVSRALQGLSGVDGLGILAALASALTFAGYLFLADVAGRRGIHPATLLLWGFLAAIVFWSVAAPWWSWPYGRLAEPKVILAVLGVGVVGTLIPFLLAVDAVPVVSPATAGIAATVEPPAAAAFAWLFLGQHLIAAQIAGGLLVIAGIALAQLRPTVARETLAVEAAP
jgi:drug/metabolite transporter (DMT)-like permease